MSLKHYLSVLVLLLLASWGYSQTNYGEIRGMVIDKKTRTPLDFVTIIVKKEGIIKGTASSDESGNYIIKTLDPGEYEIETSYVGYEPFKGTNINITSGSIKFINIELASEGTELGPVVVFGGELIEKDGGTKSVKAKDLIKMPNRGIGGIAATTSTTNVTANGRISFLGSRTDGTRVLIDGVPTIGSSEMPLVGQENIDIIATGIPAQYGDLTGGAINITTKGPTRRKSQYFEYLTSSLFDKWHYNTFETQFTGPLKIKNKGGGDKERVLFGYTVSGHLEYQKDASPTVLGSWTVKDDVLNNIKENPLTPNPDGGGFITTSSFLTQNDLVLNKARQNTPFYRGSITAKLEYTPSKTSVLTLFGRANLDKSRGYGYASSLLNFDEYSVNTNQTYFTYLRYTQKIGYQSSDRKAGDKKDGAKKPLVSDAFYSLRVDYQTLLSKSVHNQHQDNVFDYGYVGKFTHYRAPVYEWKSEPQKYIITRDNKNDTVVRQGYYELTGFRDTMITYESSDKNELRSKYTENAFDYFRTTFNSRGAFSDGQIATYNGLLNGYNLQGTYSLWYNPGTLIAGYSKSQQERFSAYAIGEATINTGKKKENKHDIQFGMTYEQNIFSGYSLSANNLWILMPQLANKHIASLDKVTQGEYILNSEHSFDDQGRFLDSVNYNVRVDKDQQSTFDKNLRKKLMDRGAVDVYGNKITETSYIDVNSLSPEDLSLDMFNADDLNNKNNQYVSYYGYDYLGNRTRKRFGINDFLLNKEERSVGSFAPIYSAAWLQDKFAIKDLIFRVGVRIERYDANQPTLKDPYSLYPIKTVGEVSELNGLQINHPDNIDDDYAIYVNNAKNPTKVLGYRKNNTWYDASGVEVANPEILAQQTASNIIQPFLVDVNNKDIVKEAFKDYEPQVNVLPRVWFSFPISSDAQFFANYDVLTQRPTDGATFTPIRSYYILESDQSRFLPNAALKPRIKTMYELGYKQKLSKVSALSLIVSYSEIRNDFGQYRYNQAYPVSYTSYANIDFSTNKAFRVEYIYKGLKNFQMLANYTLLFADGTGSNINAQSALIQANQPNLRSLYPLDVDYRHNFNTTFSYGFKAGKEYTGPMWFKKRVFENAEANVMITARSGAPYTANLSPIAEAQAGLGTVTRSQIKGNPFGSRMPWQFKTDVNFQRYFEFKKKRMRDNTASVSGLTTFLIVQNIFNGKIVQGVYAFTGLPNDDGYLNSPEGQQKISQQVSQQSFIDLYNISVNSPFNYAAPRLFRLGIRFQL
ncbi:MAG: carboxypeptidase-like regulatory domain-containing protein [Bacteroidia bacterium]